MSSKSRQKSQPKKRKGGHARAPEAGEPVITGEQPSESGLGIPDEIVHVPKNTSPLRFVLMIALVIVLLVIFVVPQALMSSVGSNEEAVYVTWDQPGEGTVELTRNQLVQERRMLSDALPILYYSAIPLGFDGRSISEENTIRFLFLDRMAEASGLHVSDADLAEFLAGQLQRLGGTESYRAYVRNKTGGVVGVENTVRRALRAIRYTQIAAMAAAVPDPAEIERMWAEEHVEQTFDFVALPLADVEEAARAELPPDEDLEAWFDALPEGEKMMMQLPERRRAEFALFRPAEGAAPTALLERFPEPEGAVAEERAQEYYDRVFFRRFLRPEDEMQVEEGEDEPQPYLSFDEVKDTCLAEAPVYFAMAELLKELRNAEDTVDLKAEAEALGLTYAAHEEPVALLDLRERTEGELGGTNLTNSVFQTNVGDLALTVIAGAEQLTIVRVVEKLDPALPPFADVRDEIADRWTDDAARDLALDRLRAIRESFTTDLPDGVEPLEDPALAGTRRFADAAAFAAAVQEAGLSVQKRDWLDKSDLAGEDPALDVDANAFFLRSANLKSMAVDQVAEPSVPLNGTAAYLVRLAGEREVDISAMTAEQYEAYKERSAMGLAQSILFQPTYEDLVENYGLWIDRSEPDEDEEADEGDDSAEG